MFTPQNIEINSGLINLGNAQKPKQMKNVGD